MPDNPDYNRELYEWQDRTVETIPKDMDNRDLGFVLEAAGDIFRELTGRQWPDGYYIGEKVGRIEKTLRHPIDRQEVLASLSDEDQDRVDELKTKWFSVKNLSTRLTAARNLNIALADQNEQAIWFNLRRFKEMWASGRVNRRPPETRRRPVAVRSHLRRRVADHLKHPPGACLCHRSRTADRVRRGLARRLRR